MITSLMTGTARKARARQEVREQTGKCELNRDVETQLKDASTTKSFVTNIWGIWRDIEKKNLPLAAAGIAYYLLLSLFPALTLLSAVFSYLPVQNGSRKRPRF